MFGFVSGMAKRIMRTVEFEPYVIFSGADPNPCWTSAAIIGRNHFFAKNFHFLKKFEKIEKKLKFFEKIADFLNFFENVIFWRNCAKSCLGGTRG